jgi:hypothetical protein
MKRERYRLRWRTLIVCLLLALPVTSAEASGPAQLSEPGDGDIVGEFVILTGWQANGRGALSDSDMDGLESGARLIGLAVFGEDGPGRDQAETPLVRGVANLCASLWNSLQALRSQPGGNPFMILYTPEAMRMNVPGQSMVWTAFPGSYATMAFADHEARRVTEQGGGDLPPRQAVTGLRNATSYRTVNWVGPGATATIANWPSQEYTYDFEVTVGRALKIRQKTEGTIWLASEHPGKAIVSSFYQNFENAIRRGEFWTNFTGGLANVLAAGSAKGVPMQGTSRSLTTSTVVGMPAAPPLPAVSAFMVAGAWLVPLTSELQNYIWGGDFPGDYEIVRMDPADFSGEQEGAQGVLREGLQQWSDGLKKKFKFGKGEKKSGG